VPRITATDGIDLITAMGLPVVVKTFTDVTVAERNARLFVRQSPPSPSSISRPGRDQQIRLYVVPRLTASLRALATEDHRIAVAAVHDGIVLLDGEERRIHTAAPTTSEERSGRRVAWGRYALLRALARTRAPRTQAQLAAETGVTQAAISQSLKRLDGLVSKTADGWAALSVREIADAFLTQYPGARGITTGWFSLDPVTRQAQLVAEAAPDEGAVISGDAGADEIAPWRKPIRAVVYGHTGLDLARLGFGDADLEHASLEYTVPADHTIWATARAYSDGRGRLLADPLICAHDILRIGGPDAADATEHLIARLERDWETR